MKSLNRLVWLGILMALGLTANASRAAEQGDCADTPLASDLQPAHRRTGVAVPPSG